MWRRCWKSTHKKCLIPSGPWVNSTSCSLVRPKSISAGYSCKSVRSIFILQDPRPRNCLFVQLSCHSWLLMIPSWLEHMSLWQPLMNVWVLSHISLWITKWDLTWQRSWKFTFLSLQTPPRPRCSQALQSYFCSTNPRRDIRGLSLQLCLLGCTGTCRTPPL